MHRNNIVFLLEIFKTFQNDILYWDAIFKNVPVPVKLGYLETLTYCKISYKSLLIPHFLVYDIYFIIYKRTN